MAYTRGDYYLWHGESGLHIWAKDGENTASGVSIHQEIMDESVMMRLAQMVYEGKVDAAIDRVLDPDGRGNGNGGSRLLTENADILKQALSGLTMCPPPPHDWEKVTSKPKLEER